MSNAAPVVVTIPVVTRTLSGDLESKDVRVCLTGCACEWVKPAPEAQQLARELSEQGHLCVPSVV